MGLQERLERLEAALAAKGARITGRFTNEDGSVEIRWKRPGDTSTFDDDESRTLYPSGMITGSRRESDFQHVLSQPDAPKSTSPSPNRQSSTASPQYRSRLRSRHKRGRRR